MAKRSRKRAREASAERHGEGWVNPDRDGRDDDFLGMNEPVMLLMGAARAKRELLDELRALDELIAEQIVRAREQIKPPLPFSTLGDALGITGQAVGKIYRKGAPGGH